MTKRMALFPGGDFLLGFLADEPCQPFWDTLTLTRSSLPKVSLTFPGAVNTILGGHGYRLTSEGEINYFGASLSSGLFLSRLFINCTEASMPQPVFEYVKMARPLSATGQGSSGAQYMASDDGTQYVVKFKENGQGLRVLVNELVANAIALHLDLPCPKGVIAEISDELIKIANIPPIQGRAVSSGCHFATKRIMNPYSNPPTQLIGQASNRNTYPGIVLFDILTFNSNRNNAGNYIVVNAGANIEFYIIDHGHCFGNPNWDVSLVQKIGTWNSQNLMNEIAECITGNDPFRIYIQKIRSISDDFINKIIDEVPAEWQLLQSEKEALRSFLIGQRDRIEEIILGSKGRFPYWN
jgi:hypothetical protein